MSDNGGNRTLISGLLDGDIAKLTFFNKGTSQTLEFRRDDARKFDELASQIRSQVADRVRVQQEVEFEKQRGAARSDIQSKIDKSAQMVAAQAQDVGQAVTTLDAVIGRHETVLAEIRRLDSIASSTRGGTYDNDTKLYEIRAAIGDARADRRQSNVQIQSYATRLSATVSDAEKQVAALQVSCTGDPLLECGKLDAALQSLKSAATKFATLHQREQVAYAAIEPR